MMVFVIAVTIAFTFIDMANAANKGEVLLEILPGMTSGYDSRILPTKNGQPVEVQVKIYVQRMAENIKATHRHFGIEFVMHTVWQDYRLKYNGSEVEDLTLVGEQTNLIWTPDITFRQKAGTTSKVTDLNQFVVISSNGSLLQSQRQTLVLFCPMDFTNFPFDEQICTIPVVSFAYNNQQLILNWHRSHIRTGKYGATFDQYKKMDEFYIEDYATSKMKQNYGFSGVYDVLTFTLHFHRRFPQYFVRIFLPLMLIVLLSFVSFWIDYRSSPARTIIATTIFLTAMMFIVSLQKTFPPTTSMRSIDLYSLGCFLFVFGTIIEFAVVQTVDIQVRAKNRTKKRDTKTEVDGLSLSNQTESNPSDDRKSSRKIASNRVSQHREAKTDDEVPNNNKQGRKRKESAYQRAVEKIYAAHEQHLNEYHVVDEISKKLFPITFAFMNALYFIVFIFIRH